MPTIAQRVGARELRRRFNEGHFVERAAAGELVETIQSENHPSPPLANEPFCTKSQLVVYKEPNGRKVAWAHRYKRPDGSIGLSGRADPKRIREGDNLYILEPRMP
jgi:hypothetical protein